jgi:hypothetical protein
MRKYNYLLPSTNSLWTSFDNGEVWASSEQEARAKAISQLNYDVQKVNEVLAAADVTAGFEISICTDQIEIEETDVYLVDVIIQQIKQDIASGDVTVLAELLERLPAKTLIAYLPEQEAEDWKLEWNG